MDGVVNVVAEVAQVGTGVFHILADGVKDIANTSVGTVAAIGDDVFGFFAPVGGLGPFLLYLLNFGIVVYLALNHWRYGGLRRRLSPDDSPPVLPLRIPIERGGDGFSSKFHRRGSVI